MGTVRFVVCSSARSQANVLYDASCPVWTAAHTTDKASDLPAPAAFACAVDLGPQSSNILNWASRLSREFGAPLRLIHVVASLDPRLQDYGSSPERRCYVISDVEAELERLQDTAGVHGETRAEIGPIVGSVANAAKEVRADLLIIGRSGDDSIAGRLHTNAYAIIVSRQAQCSVSECWTIAHRLSGFRRRRSLIRRPLDV